jgi:RNA polymerase sigma-70 factor, ECF subfamily
MVPSGREESVVKAARGGDAQAFGVLVDTHYPVTALVAGFLAERDQADEAVERTWLAVVDTLNQWDGTESLRAWLCALLIDELDRSQALDRAEGDAPPEPGRFLDAGDRWTGWWKGEMLSWAGFGDEFTPSDTVRNAAVDAVRSLPMVQRVMVLLRDVAGLSLDECGSIVGRTKEDQATLLHWARSSVQQTIERQFDGHEKQRL